MSAHGSAGLAPFNGGEGSATGGADRSEVGGVSGSGCLSLTAACTGSRSVSGTG